MRRYGYLKNPFFCNKNQMVYKVMVDEIEGFGVYTYIYTDKDAMFCSYDTYSEDLDTALAEWEGELDEQGWILLDDPLADCQRDCFLPIRVKGRESGKPQWGKYEQLLDGIWIDYIKEEKK